MSSLQALSCSLLICKLAVALFAGGHKERVERLRDEGAEGTGPVLNYVRDAFGDATLLGLDESTQQSTGSNMLGLDESTQQSTGSNSNHVIPKFEQEDSNMSFPDNSMDSEFKYG